MTALPDRKRLHHDIPSWVADGSLYFVTICTQPRGMNQLCAPVIGEKLIASADFYQSRGTWWLKIFLLMPDHLHTLVAVPKEESLPIVIRRWKAYQKQALGIKWQSGFFDHRLRSDESEEEKAHYIRMNPVRAGLADKPADWPYILPTYDGNG